MAFTTFMLLNCIPGGGVWAEVGVPLVAGVAVGCRAGLVRPAPVRVKDYEAVLRIGLHSTLESFWDSSRV